MEHDQLYTSEKMDTFNQRIVNVRECEREKKGLNNKQRRCEHVVIIIITYILVARVHAVT